MHFCVDAAAPRAIISRGAAEAGGIDVHNTPALAAETTCAAGFPSAPRVVAGCGLDRMGGRSPLHDRDRERRVPAFDAHATRWTDGHRGPRAVRRLSRCTERDGSARAPESPRVPRARRAYAGRGHHAAAAVRYPSAGWDVGRAPLEPQECSGVR